MQERFFIELRVDEFDGHKGVTFKLFHDEWLPDAIYRDWLPAPLDWTDLELRTAVNDTFDAEEVEALRKYFAGWEEVTFKVRKARPIRADQCGLGVIPVGGVHGVYRFSEHDDFPFRSPCTAITTSDVWRSGNMMMARHSRLFWVTVHGPRVTSV
jgi:hypothetical protein